MNAPISLPIRQERRIRHTFGLSRGHARVIAGLLYGGAA